MPSTIVPPESAEYAPHFERYISKVPAGDLLTTLAKQPVAALLVGLTDEQADYRYAPGKWSIKEVLGHIIDTERIMAYRVLRVGRNDQTDLPGFDQDPYVEFGGFGSRTIADLLEEYRIVRSSTLCLLRGLPSEAMTRTGRADGKAVTTRALAWIITGHELYHTELFKERYGL